MFFVKWVLALTGILLFSAINIIILLCTLVGAIGCLYLGMTDFSSNFLICNVLYLAAMGGMPLVLMLDKLERPYVEWYEKAFILSRHSH